jgi:hypothetical protein
VGLRFSDALSYLLARGIESFEGYDQLRDCFDNPSRGVIAGADRFEQPRLRLGLERASKLLTTLFEPRLIVRRRLVGDREAACELIAMSLEIIERRLNRVGLFDRLAERSLEPVDIPLKVFVVRHGNQERSYSSYPIDLVSHPRVTAEAPASGPCGELARFGSMAALDASSRDDGWAANPRRVCATDTTDSHSIKIGLVGSRCRQPLWPRGVASWASPV